ncbi:MAG: TonB-dependent receptor, partial [Glaciecola sp.]
MKHGTMKLTLLALAISSSMSINAQTTESRIERIKVTGSHIKRTDMEGPSPVTSLSSKDIADAGVTDLIGLFTKLPAAGQGTFSTQGNSSDGTANGGSSV